MTRTDATMIAGALGVPASVPEARVIAWISAVWYYGLPVDTSPATRWNEWWNLRCMLGCLDAVPFKLPKPKGPKGKKAPNDFCRHEFSPPPSAVRDGLRKLWLTRWGANLRLRPPGGYEFPPGGEPWTYDDLPGELRAKALAETQP